MSAVMSDRASAGPADLQFLAGFEPSPIEKQIAEIVHQIKRQEHSNNAAVARQYGNRSMHPITSHQQIHRLKSVLHTLLMVRDLRANPGSNQE